MEFPIRVLHIISKLSFGGVQTVLMNYYRNIDRSKIQFDFIVQNNEDSVYEEEVSRLGGRIFHLPSMHLNRRLFELSLLKLLKKHPEYKIIHAHQNFMNIVPLRIAKKAGVNVRISHSHSNYPANSFLKKIMRKIYYLILPFYTTDYFSCSEASAIWLHGQKIASSNKSVLVQNAIDTDKFLMNMKIREKIRKNLSIEDKFVIVHVGMFGKSKNHEFLLKIFREFYKIYDKAVLMLIGDGDKKSNLINLTHSYGIEKQVLFLGRQENVNQYLMAADFFLFPSINEGLPLVVIEAQASGLKCLVSEAVPREINVTGLVKWCSLKKSPKVWADLIETNYNRQNTKSKIIKGRYDIKHEAKRLKCLYEREVSC